MIKITINGSAIELLPDTSITLHFQSPIFFDEGTYSLTIRIANSINNRRILNYPSSIGNISNQPLSYPCEIQANSFRLKGLLIITSIAADKISAYYTDSIGQFNYMATDKYLTDIIDADAPVRSSVYDYFAYLFDSINYSYPDRRFVIFPHSNLALFDKTKMETSWRGMGGEINEWDPIANEFKPYINEYNIPHFYLCHILSRMFSTFGFNLNHNFFYNNAELRQLVIMSDFFKEQNKIIINDHKADDHTVNPAWFLPKYPIKSFINDLRMAFFCEVFINSRSQQVDIKSLKEILTSVDYIDISDKADKNFVIEFEEEKNGYDIGFDTDDLDNLMNGIIDLDKFGRGDDVATRADLPEYTGVDVYAHENEIRLVRDENKFFCWCNDLSYGFRWLFITENYNHKLSGSSDITRKSSAVYPIMIERLNQLIPTMEVQAFDLDDHPLKDQGGSYYDILPDFIANNKPRLVFWHGIVQMYPAYPGATFAPFASGNNYYKDAFDVYRKITGKTIALIMDGEEGLFNTFGQEYINWWFNQKKDTKWKINWTTIDLHSLDFSAKYRINNQNYLVKSIEATINIQGNMEVKDTKLALT
jgi:hypothetical protein